MLLYFRAVPCAADPLAETADLPVEATHPARHCLVGLGRFQRTQAAGSYQDHLVVAAATGLMNPGHPGPPRAVALVALPGEQVPGHAARQLDQRRRPWRRVPRHDSSMRSYVRFICFYPAICLHLLVVSRRRDPLFAKEVAATDRPAAAQVKSAAGLPVSARESPYVTLVAGTGRGSWCADHLGGRRHCPGELPRQLAVSPHRGRGTVRTCLGRSSPHREHGGAEATPLRAGALLAGPERAATGHLSAAPRHR